MSETITRYYDDSVEALRDARDNKAANDVTRRMIDAIELIVMKLANDAGKVDQLLQEFPHLEERLIER
jgi:hypothetical protein